MHYQRYISRMHDKINKAIDAYQPYMFTKEQKFEEVYTLETMEHLRTPPQISQMQLTKGSKTWGKEYSNLWIRFEYTVPEELDSLPLVVIPDANAVEILCFKNGKSVGIINSKNNFLGGFHGFMFLTDKAVAGEKFDIAFECYAGHTCLGTFPYENYGVNEKEFKQNFSHTYSGVKVAVFDKAVKDFIFDLSTVVQISDLDPSNFIAKCACDAIDEAFPHIILDVMSAAREELYDSIVKVKKIIAPVLKKKKADSSRGTVGLIGHSHMDTAWLWPVSETVRKCARTYSEVLTLMDMYPDYTFVQSSALHSDWMREYYPDIFEGIKKRVAEGRYEPNGAVWVECDCNITSGESMVRQFLFGQRFTQKHFGYRSDCFWLPDTFGYNANIPQIMLQSGVKYFYTTKMSWNDLNTFPYDSFVWRGIDGSEVLSHFNCIHTMPDVKKIFSHVAEIKDKRATDLKLVSYGFGDGGGGPTFGMIEYANRVTDLEGLPKIKPTSVSSFMKKLEKDRKTLPVYDGELYLELHRGTLTQMHEVKKNNRLGEIALYKMELLNVVSEEKTNEKTEELYKILLINQFHDILPGTSIPPVYDRTKEEMTALISSANDEIKAYADKMSSKAEKVLSIYNPLSFERRAVTVLDGEYSFENAVSQVYTDFDNNKKTAVSIQIPALSSVCLKKGNDKSQKSAFKRRKNTLTTPFYKVKFDKNGYIASLFDIKADREVKREGGESLGALLFAEDVSYVWENWDIDDDVFKKLEVLDTLVSSEVVADGAVEYRIRNKYVLRKTTTIELDIVFYASSRQIDFEMKTDWKARRTILKAGFDVNVRSGFVKNEIQFGHIERPTTKNNSWEAAKYEVCNHKWSDLSETHYGVAILNDCKYGISIDSSNMCLTLHKGGCRPDPFTEFGIHTMTYSLLPHVDGFEAKNVVHPAYELNYTPVVAEGEFKGVAPFEISNGGIICEAVKPSEDIENAFVIRLYESEKNHTSCTVTFKDAKKVWLVNMLEEKQKEIKLTNGKINLRFNPFEIKSLLIER